MKKFDNFSSNLNVLKYAEKENLENEFIISGIIDKFILQFELSWKVLKLCLKYEGKGVANSGSPREILKAAYSTYEFLDEKIWLEMLKARNDMSHIYDGNAARKMVHVILTKFIPEFLNLQSNLQKIYGNLLEEM